MGERAPTDSTFLPNPSATQGEDAVWPMPCLADAQFPMPIKKPGMDIPSSKQSRISFESW
ncbi:hypothetical protein [Microcoleus sp. Pol11C2]|uniref:hypothetical protein n=1 Tax=Microcoleus sp. Pol11C2 TaxID=3055389 RepID=UPI002FCF18A7